MRVNANLFWILAGFFCLADAIYIVWNLVRTTTPSRTRSRRTHPSSGSAWSASASPACSASSSPSTSAISRRAQGGELPEDRLDAEIDDGDPEVGYFSPWSWWPMVLALGTALVFLGLAVGIWICFIGAPLAFLAIIGWYYEYYRGNFAR